MMRNRRLRDGTSWRTFMRLLRLDNLATSYTHARHIAIPEKTVFHLICPLLGERPWAPTIYWGERLSGTGGVLASLEPKSPVCGPRPGALRSNVAVARVFSTHRPRALVEGPEAFSAVTFLRPADGIDATHPQEHRVPHPALFRVRFFSGAGIAAWVEGESDSRRSHRGASGLPKSAPAEELHRGNRLSPDWPSRTRSLRPNPATGAFP